MSPSCLASRIGGKFVRTWLPACISLALAVTITATPAATRSAQAARVESIAPQHNVAESSTNPIQVAANDPVAAFFSIFAKKKPKPVRVIVVPPKTLPRGLSPNGRIIRTPNGRRIFNPYLPYGQQSRPAAPQSKQIKTGRRTMCVRLCDGYYWPMRRGGSNNSLTRDSQRCESQCKSASRLFVLHTSTDGIATMRDLGGRPYSKLPNAFKYRKTFNPSCRCNAEPWSERAQLRHRQYSAVGKERRELAIRSITLDLRKTVGPVVEKVALDTAAGVQNYWDPALPTRKPIVALAMSPGPVALSRATSSHFVTQSGEILLTSAIDTMPAVPEPAEAAAPKTTAVKRPAVRVLNFRDFPSAQKPKMSRHPAWPRTAQSRRPATPFQSRTQFVLRATKDRRVPALRPRIN